MCYQSQSSLSFFLLSVYSLFWFNYYPLVNQVNAQIIVQKPPSSQDILDLLQEVILNAKDE